MKLDCQPIFIDRKKDNTILNNKNRDNFTKRNSVQACNQAEKIGNFIFPLSSLKYNNHKFKKSDNTPQIKIQEHKHKKKKHHIIRNRNFLHLLKTLTEPPGKLGQLSNTSYTISKKQILENNNTKKKKGKPMENTLTLKNKYE